MTVPTTSLRFISPVEVVVVAASTGGPDALRLLLSHLGGDLAVPVAIVQHIPPDFIAPLARRLSDITGLKVSEASDGADVRSAQVWLAAGDRHLRFQRRRGELILTTDREPAVNSVRPSADILFQSAVEVFRAGVLAVVLTGMGQDGCAGSEAVVQAGGSAFVQDRESSVVWGMPGAVVKAGFAELVLPLDELAAAIRRRVRHSHGIVSGEYRKLDDGSDGAP